jgi:hypothetical protein
MLDKQDYTHPRARTPQCYVIYTLPVLYACVLSVHGDAPNKGKSAESVHFREMLLLVRLIKICTAFVNFC